MFCLSGPLALVRSRDVVPDATNREYTQLSVEHVHFIAHCIATQGFRARQPGSGEGHDIPVVVRSAPGEPLGEEALAAWQTRTQTYPGFPRCEIRKETQSSWFSSLGNGHFNQALNLYRLEWGSVLAYGSCWKPNPADKALHSAIHNGVPSVVLKLSTPRAVRMQISLLLNQSHRLKWDAHPESGECFALPMPAVEAKLSQFEALSKVVDSQMLSSLVRTKFNVDYDQAQTGYAKQLNAKL
jgi:hypothetical protein